MRFVAQTRKKRWAAIRYFEHAAAVQTSRWVPNWRYWTGSASTREQSRNDGSVFITSERQSARHCPTVGWRFPTVGQKSTPEPFVRNNKMMAFVRFTGARTVVPRLLVRG